MTLPIANHCIILVGQKSVGLWVLAHTIVNAFFYGVVIYGGAAYGGAAYGDVAYGDVAYGDAAYGGVVAKIHIVRRSGTPGWLPPLAGGLLFTLPLDL